MQMQEHDFGEVPTTRVLGPNGGFQDLIAYQIAEIVYDGTVVFCRRAFKQNQRIVEQMTHAARSGKQNIAEGSAAAAASQNSEIYLVNCARASLEELRIDFEDYLRQNGLPKWDKSDPKAEFIRKLHKHPDRSYDTYRIYLEDKSVETAANTLICLCFQAKYLLDKLLRALERDVITKGGYSERLSKARMEFRKKKP